MFTNTAFPVRIAGVGLTLMLIAAVVIVARNTGASAQAASKPWPAAGCDYADPVYPSTGFGDVQTGSFYETAVAWAKASNITKGTGGGAFAPNDLVTRAQMATFLWRMVCEPSGTPRPGFSDVPENQYFTDAVAWLKASKVTNGTGPSTFSPSAVVTRAQMAAFIWRLAGQPTGTPDSGFTDVPSGQYYTEGVNWLKVNGITKGVGETSFAPQLAVTRAQMVTFLYRFAIRYLFLGTWNLNGNGQLQILPGEVDDVMSVRVLDQGTPNAADLGTVAAITRSDSKAKMVLTDTANTKRAYELELLTSTADQELEVKTEYTYPAADLRGVNCEITRYRRAPNKGTAPKADYDCDGIPVDFDNCPGVVQGNNNFTANPDQKDTDKDGTGDLCDTNSVRTTAALVASSPPIDGGPVDYTLTLARGADAPTTVTVQTWVRQGNTRRVVDTNDITCTTPSCEATGTITVKDQPPATGTGTFVPGAAAMEFELKHTNQTLHRFGVDVTLVAAPGLTKAPIVAFMGTETDATGTKYKIPVTNIADFDDALFALAPALPPCQGLNANGPRTEISIRRTDTGQKLAGSCTVTAAAGLATTSFSLPAGQSPPSGVYLELIDRQDETITRSNIVNVTG